MSEVHITDTLYEDGIEVVCVGEERSWGVVESRTYLVFGADGETSEFSDHWKSINRRQARLWAELKHQIDGVEMCKQNHLIPTEVAVLGKPAIAAYLYSVHSFTIEAISNQMDVTESTIQQYFTRFRSKTSST